MKNNKILLLVILVLAVFLGVSSTYSLRENEYGIRLQFNKIVAIDESAGLYFKIPFIQNVRKVPKSIQLYDIRPSDVMTSDKKSMIADMYILWRVVNPTVYYQTLNANVNNAKDRTGITVYNSVKSVISSMTQDEIIEARGEKLTQTITSDANPDIQKYGIEIVQAQLKSLDLPDDNKQAVYERMISERNNIAASYTAEGESKAKKIQNEKIDGNTPALISFTSGSTGFPKIIMRTHEFLLGQHNVLEKNLKFEKETAVYSSFPIFLLSHMATGTTTFIPDLNWRKPVESDFGNIIKQITKNNIQNIILPPAIFENIVKFCKDEKIMLENVQKVYTGGAPVFYSLMKKIKDVFTNAKIIALYGASEAEPISVLNFEDITEEDIENMKNGEGLLAGKIVNEIELKIEELEKMPKKNKILNNNNVEDFSALKGEILVKGENVVNGYLNVEKNPNENWHKTGDMGYINKKGQLILLGRVKGRIQIEENIYYPFTVETAFSFCKNLKKSVLTSKNNKLYLFAERNPEFKGNLSEDNEIKGLKEKFGIFKIIETEIPMDKRHNSKTDYKRLEEIVEQI